MFIKFLTKTFPFLTSIILLCSLGIFLSSCAYYKAHHSTYLVLKTQTLNDANDVTSTSLQNNIHFTYIGGDDLNECVQGLHISITNHTIYPGSSFVQIAQSYNDDTTSKFVNNGQRFVYITSDLFSNQGSSNQRSSKSYTIKTPHAIYSIGCIKKQSIFNAKGTAYSAYYYPKQTMLSVHPTNPFIPYQTLKACIKNHSQDTCYSYNPTLKTFVNSIVQNFEYHQIYYLITTTDKTMALKSNRQHLIYTQKNFITGSLKDCIDKITSLTKTEEEEHAFTNQNSACISKMDFILSPKIFQKQQHTSLGFGYGSAGFYTGSNFHARSNKPLSFYALHIQKHHVIQLKKYQIYNDCVQQEKVCYITVRNKKSLNSVFQ